jgi:hypothetical protein
MAGARDIIDNTLAEYGLAEAYANDGESLSEWAWNRYLETGDADLVMVELRSQQAFKDRFPAYDILAEKGRALSPAEYIAYEQTLASMLQNYGVPDGIFDLRDVVTEMLTNDVSATEFSERLAINAEASLTAPPEVAQSLQDMYGVGPGEMLAYYLDPDRALPKLQQQYTAAQIRGAALERQFTLDRQRAERFAELGYTYEQARAAAEAADTARGLTGGANAVGATQLFGSGLGDTAAITAVRRAIASRQARFAGGGTAAQEREGISGLAASGS